MNEYHLTWKEYKKLPDDSLCGKYIVERVIFYWVNGKKHREDGPAIEYSDGEKYWYFNDKRHRLDGPAVEWSKGIHIEYFINGEFYDSKEEYEIAVYLYKNNLESYK